MTPNPTDDRLKFILKTYGAKKPYVVAAMVLVIANTIGDDDLPGDLAARDNTPFLAAPTWATTETAESMVAFAIERPAFRARHAADPLFPWIAQQLGKLGKADPPKFSIVARTLSRQGTMLAQWYQATQPNLGQVTVEEALAAAEKWSEDSKNKSEPILQGEVVAKLSDGWTAQNLTTLEQLDAEGENMQHCSKAYAKKVASGLTTIYSLRDALGHPHVTIEVVEKFLGQVKGKQNAKPAEKYQKYVSEFKSWLKEDGVRTEMAERLIPWAAAIRDHSYFDDYDEEEGHMAALADAWRQAVATVDDAIEWFKAGVGAMEYESAEALEAEGVTPEEFLSFGDAIRYRMEEGYRSRGLINIARMAVLLASLSDQRAAKPVTSQSELFDDKEERGRVPGQDPMPTDYKGRSPSISFGSWSSDASDEDRLWLYPAEEWINAGLDTSPDSEGYVEPWFIHRFSSMEADLWISTGIGSAVVAADLRRRRVTPKLVEELVEARPSLILSKMDGIDVVDALEDVGLQRNGKRASRRRASKRTSKRSSKRTSRRRTSRGRGV